MTTEGRPDQCRNGHSKSEYGYVTPSGRRVCRQCNSINTRKYRQKDAVKETVRQRTNASNQQVRLETLVAYGGACVCCGEDREPFLVIDHVNGDGSAHRAIVRNGGGSKSGGGVWTYRWLKKNGWPEGFQVLCANCNMAKERPGGCPHVR